ncbi:MAG: HEAT repeat domain-containing protein, partial [Acidobacteria bacterium]|nr:HEAT repeat domain-containing protein [Acidobacteriota bacterium]
MNDYSAYRSGDRFYVVLPKADADALPKGGGGRGYSDMQVQRRGNGDVVLSYKVQPGSKPRVEQKFNRLDVVFDTDGSTSAASTNSARTSATPQTPAPNENRNPVNDARAATQNAQQSSAQTATQTERRPTTSAERVNPSTVVAQPESNPQPGVGVVQPQLPTSLPPATPESPAASISATPAAEQLAQAEPPASTVPITTTASNTTNAPSGVSFGAVVLRNWPLALILALLVVGLGLFFVSRRDATESRPAPEVAASGGAAGRVTLKQPTTAKLPSASTNLNFSDVETTQTGDATPVIAASTLAASTLATATTQEEASTLEEETLVAEQPAIEEQPEVEDLSSVEALFVEEAQPAIETQPVDGDAALEALTLGGAVIAASGEAVTSTEIAPAEAADSERVQAETRRLLDGEAYNKNIIGSADMLTRQLIVSELLSALSGRNPERRERARRAFVEHGFFNESAHDLHFADAPAERTSAARALALAGDRAATSHLVAALEDPNIEVRRTAVESLATMRDPKAVAPLEALVAREKHQKNKVNRKLLQRAIEACRAGVEEAPAPIIAPDTVATQPEAIATHELVEAQPEAEASLPFAEHLAAADVVAATTAVEPVVEVVEPFAATPSLVEESETQAPVVEQAQPTGTETLAGEVSPVAVDAMLHDDEGDTTLVAELPPVESAIVDESETQFAVEDETQIVEAVLPPAPEATPSFVEEEAETPTLATHEQVEGLADVEPQSEIELYEPTPAGASLPEPQFRVAADEFGTAQRETALTDEWVELDMHEARTAPTSSSSIEPYASSIEAPHVDSQPHASTATVPEAWAEE